MRKMIWLVLFALLCVPAVAENKSLLNLTTGRYYGPEWAWTREAWTGDDRPYQQIRAEVDALIAKGQKADALYPKYRVLAQKQPTSPEALYRWAYTAYQAANEPGVKRADGIEKIGRAEWTFLLLPSPHTYEYDRLRFLIKSYFDNNNAMNDAGKRFLEREPNNIEIQRYVIQNLSSDDVWREYSYSRVLADHRRALTLAQEFLQEHSGASWPYKVIGNVYYNLWNHNNQQTDADQAVTSYRKYLQDITIDDRSRRVTNTHLMWIRDGQVPLNGQYVPRDLLPDSMRSK